MQKCILSNLCCLSFAVCVVMGPTLFAEVEVVNGTFSEEGFNFDDFGDSLFYHDIPSWGELGEPTAREPHPDAGARTS